MNLVFPLQLYRLEMKLLMSLVALVGLSAGAPQKTSLSCDCGWTNSGRIVGGTETTPNKYPWMASLFVYNEPNCGASIITPWHALTAAHCGVLAPARAMKLVIGAHDITENMKSVVVDVKKVINHENYDEETVDYDIALLVTATKMPFSKIIGPVCMPSKPLNLDYEFIKVMGWGDTENMGTSSDVLLEVDLTVMPKQQCQRQWKGSSLDQKICATGIKKDSCQGDSGGPLVWLDPKTNRYTQAALVSYGAECGGSKPSVNTDVSTYIDWINKHVQATKPGTEVCRMV